MSKKYDYIQEGLTDKNFHPLPWGILTVVAVLAGSALYAIDRFTVVGVNENLTDLGGDIFLKYLFIVVAVERAAAVFVGMSRSQSNVDWSLRIKRINEILHKEDPPLAVLKQVHARESRLVEKLVSDGTIGAIAAVPGTPDVADYLGYLTSTKHAYEFQKARFDSVTNRYVARAVFFAGILLAALGLSIFQDLVENMKLVELMKEQIATNPAIEAGLKWQTGLLRLADIIVTGGLLGGGSAGLNAIATRMTEFLDKQAAA